MADAEQKRSAAHRPAEPAPASGIVDQEVASEDAPDSEPQLFETPRPRTDAPDPEPADETAGPSQDEVLPFESPIDPVEPEPADSGLTEEDDEEEDEVAPTRRRRGPRLTSPPPRPPVWRRVGFAILMVVLLVGGATAAYVGARTVGDSTGGELVDVTNDPTAPGYEAQVTPSPTMLLIHRNGDEAVGFTFLVLGPRDQGGSIILIPTETIAPLPEFGDQPLSLAYSGGGASVVTNVIQTLFGTGILESLEVDDPRWTSLTEPLAPLTFTNPDDVFVTDDESGTSGLLFPSGEIDLEAVGVGQYLSSASEGESDLARLARNEAFWRTWLDDIAASDDEGAVPGETDSGIGRFVRGLASGPVNISTLPVTEDNDPERDGMVFLPEENQIESLITDVVPLPTSPDFGVRARVRLLNGTEDAKILDPLVQPLVDAGATLAVYGNAESFDIEKTRIVYTDSIFADDARAFQEALGVGEIVREERPIENIDVTVVIGADYT